MPFLKSQKNPVPHDGQMELMDHLAELRTRLFRSVVYVIVGMILTYNLFPWIYDILQRPIDPIVAKFGHFMVTSIAQPFLIRMQVSFIAGLVVSFPFITLEMWRFIAPALTPEERKPVNFLAPFSVLLFLAGVGTAYAALPAAYGWMASYLPDIHNVNLQQDSQSYIVLTVKLLLAFGVSFQLPLVLLFLARVGIINADLMRKYWRHATVGIATVAAIVTPSNDPLTMLMMAIPMAGLYLLSISLVRAFEPKPDGTRSLGFAAMLLITLLPVSILIAVGLWLWHTHGA